MKNGKETARNHGKFARGTAPGPGRAKGSRNRSTLVGRELMRALEAGDEDGLLSALDRWKRLLNDDDSGVRLAAERFVYQALYGLPRAQIELDASIVAFLASPAWIATQGVIVEAVRPFPEVAERVALALEAVGKTGA